jgi:hypothetical protein
LSIINQRLEQTIIRKLNLYKLPELPFFNPGKIDLSSFLIPHIFDVDIISFGILAELGKPLKVAGPKILGAGSVVSKNIARIIEINPWCPSDRARKTLRKGSYSKHHIHTLHQLQPSFRRYRRDLQIASQIRKNDGCSYTAAQSV